MEETRLLREKRYYRLGKIERQLLLYEIFSKKEVVSFEDIVSRFPMKQRKLEGDLVDLKTAGLISVRFSRLQNAYIPDWRPEKTIKKLKKPEEWSSQKKKYYAKLRRLAKVISELQHDEIDFSEPFDRSRYKSCKDYYFEMLPGSGFYTMCSDFDLLKKLGYPIQYIPEIDFYLMWDRSGELREDFGVVKEGDEWYRYPCDKNIPKEPLWDRWTELVPEHKRIYLTK